MASTHPKFLKSIALPSITGSQASQPIFPSHKTAVPSLTIATVLDFQVYSYASSGFFAISRQGWATQGV
jgi:hypothetical protein